MLELPRRLVVVALRAETQGVFEAAGIPVLYCGVGKVNAAIALARELARYVLHGQAMPLVLNFGSAGSRRHAAGTLVACHEFVQRDMDVRGLGYALGVTPFDDAPANLRFEPVFTHLPAAVCGSGDSFATAAADANGAGVGNAGVDCAVVDMEAYALAKVCWYEKAPFASAKYVSDGADHAAADDWQRNLHKAADEFLRLYLGVAR
ncbi:MAG TPA: 5'-nucleosidase [Steroidobacteraceae bacterium]|jgi:adenosylhomocysteine nucleosidase|nr:5'-nucleosidase [Steroidobacteraceae bacterium]